MLNDREREEVKADVAAQLRAATAPAATLFIACGNAGLHSMSFISRTAAEQYFDELRVLLRWRLFAFGTKTIACSAGTLTFRKRDLRAVHLTGNPE